MSDLQSVIFQFFVIARCGGTKHSFNLKQMFALSRSGNAKQNEDYIKKV